MTSCVPLTAPRPSQCNGFDNDCDGVIDTGPCPAGQVCDGTACVPMCVEGACFGGQTCSDAGLCEDNSCIGVTCPACAASFDVEAAASGETLATP